MSCKAISGTGWEFTVTDKSSDEDIYDEKGKTGEKLESRNNQRIANFSERIKSI